MNQAKTKRSTWIIGAVLIAGIVIVFASLLIGFNRDHQALVDAIGTGRPDPNFKVPPEHYKVINVAPLKARHSILVNGAGTYTPEGLMNAMARFGYSLHSRVGDECTFVATTNAVVVEIRTIDLRSENEIIIEHQSGNLIR